MDEYSIVRSVVLRIGRGLSASSPLAKAIIDWAQPHSAWLLENAQVSDELGWDELMAEVTQPRQRHKPRPHALQMADDLAELLALPPFDAALLTMIIAFDRLPRVTELVRVAARHDLDVPALLGELAGAERHDAARRVKRSPLLRLGLVSLNAKRHGDGMVEVQWTLERVLDHVPADREALTAMLVGPRQTAALGMDAFAHVADADLLVRLLRGATAEHAAGINILIHGPPGTGKTELARTIAYVAGVALHSVGEADDDGDEPDRHERVGALQLAQRLLAGRAGAALLFDEMEDLIGDATPSRGDWLAKRQGSKLFVNRLLETNPAPVIWTTNAIGNVDSAVLRRMSYVLKLDLPPRAAALRMLASVARDERVTPGSRYTELLEIAPETATVLRVAARAGRLAGEADGGVRPAEALVRALRGGELPPTGPATLDMDLFETDMPLEALFAAMRDGHAEDVSLLLTGPPGTGKTALAHHLARTLDRPLIVKRASDLLSKWVGETEAQIAAAFAEARQRGGVLLFDEADSLLFDRSTAHRSWEVGQVNEMLTWLDRHPLPVVAATNHPQSLDPATLRRFVFKLDLRPLSRDRAARAFERFFGLPAPAALSHLANLTPGDFAVVARQLRHVPATSAVVIVERLTAEAGVKPGGAGRIGF